MHLCQLARPTLRRRGRYPAALPSSPSPTRRSESMRRRARSRASSLSRSCELTPWRFVHPAPTPVRSQLPGVRLVGEDEIEHLEEAGLELGVVHRDDDLDPAIEIAAHEVGRADVDLEGQARSGRRVGRRPTEAVDPRVLEEAADDGTDADVLRQLGDARTQPAQAADGQVDLHAGARGAVEGVDHGRIGQAVELEHDASRGAGVSLLLDHGHDALAHA